MSGQQEGRGERASREGASAHQAQELTDGARLTNRRAKEYGSRSTARSTAVGSLTGLLTDGMCSVQVSGVGSRTDDRVASEEVCALAVMP